MKRVLCLYLPQLSLERPGTAAAGSVREPFVVTGARHGVLVAVQANEAARRHGVRPGMTVAEARALVPRVQATPHDARADRRALEALAEWASCLSPIVHIEDPETLLLDVTGCERLFRGEGNLVRRAVEGLQERGFAARAALADTPGAAWALAHDYYGATIVVKPGQTAAAIARLPIESLRIDSKAGSALRAVGIETIEALLHLPRSSVAARFGEAVLHRLDQALGRVGELLTPFRPPLPLKSHLYLGGATNRRDILNEAIDRVLATFCEQLAARVAGVRRVHVTFHGDAGGPYTFDVNTSRATRSAKRLRLLVTTRLEGFRLSTPVHTVTVWTRQVEALDAWQNDLFETTGRDGEALADLVDRLSMRLGADRVVRPELLSNHQPERAYRYRPMVGTAATEQRSNGAAKGHRRPLRLFDRPVEVTAMALVPDGPPVWFRWQGRRYDVADCTGPERIETGWWRGPHVQRDYFRVTSSSGSRFWLFRDRDACTWFLHGLFD